MEEEQKPVKYNSLIWVNNPMDNLITITESVYQYNDLQNKYYHLYNMYQVLYNAYLNLKNRDNFNEIYDKYYKIGFALKPVCIYCGQVSDRNINVYIVCSNPNCMSRKNNNIYTR